jgi:hypothetical protein
MSVFSDLLDAFADGVTGSAPRQEAAPVPDVSPLHRLRMVAPAPWHAPDASGNGHFAVHRDVLETVARGMLSEVADLDAVAGKVQSAAGGLDSLSLWPTGAAFAGNAASACQAFAVTGRHAGDVQADAAKSLGDTAASYEEAESASRQAISGVGSQIDAAGGSVYAAGGI